jgi:hypothetical protein
MPQMSREEVARRRNLGVEQVERLQRQRGLGTDAIATLGERTLRRLLLRLEYRRWPVCLPASQWTAARCLARRA